MDQDRPPEAVVAPLVPSGGRLAGGAVAGERPAGVVDFAPALAAADALLYEGYLLYPYRQSSVKNRVRWQFGVLAPRTWVEARGPVEDGVAGSSEWWWSQTQCLLAAGPGARVDLRLRYLQLETRHQGAGGGARRASQAGGPFDEAVPQEVVASCALSDAGGTGVTLAFAAPAGDETRLGVRRSRQAVSGALHVAAERVDGPSRLYQPLYKPLYRPLYRLNVRVENTAAAVDPGAPRAEALRRSLVSTHLLLGVGEGEGSFLSLLDPPAWARAAAGQCHNVRTFPVLAGDAGSGGIVLSSPIILYDHPQVAPESPGDLFDATEIDEILSLRTLALTEDEKAEARATDHRAAEIVDRVEAMPSEVLARLHGAVRSLRPVRRAPEPQGQAGGWSAVAPWWGSADADAAKRDDHDPHDHDASDNVVVAGVRLTKGSRVRLRPRARGTDAQDMFLAGRTATVESLLTDVDGTRFLAVGLDGDPRVALDAGPGRLLHFSPDEVEPLDAGEGRR